MLSLTAIGFLFWDTLGMMPIQSFSRLPSLWFGSFALIYLAGCASFGDADSELPDDLAVLADETVATKLVGKHTYPVHFRFKQIESIALVTGLAGTGSDPSASSQRSVLTGEMQTRNVINPTKVLADPNTSLVLVQATLPPGIQKGERFDLTVTIPRRSDTTSLEGGYLMATRLKEMAALNNQIRTGHIFGAGQGALLIESSLSGSDDPVLKTRARIPGGGVASQSRPLGLAIHEDYKSFQLATQIAKAINLRFHTYESGKKKGVANPIRDNYLELAIANRYKNNLNRYLYVVAAVAVDESGVERQERMELLRRQIEEPTTTEMATLRLEAVGKEAIPILKWALASHDLEVRFNAAEALAYLDDPEAAPFLAAAMRIEPAYRSRAIVALSVLNDMNADDELLRLLDEPSAETRYGAFRALRMRSIQNAQVKGKLLNKQFYLHVLSNRGPDMVHISTQRRPEIVLFGTDVRLRSPINLALDNYLVIKSTVGDGIQVSRFAPNMPDEHFPCSNRLEDVIDTVATLGTGYSTVVKMLQTMQRKQYLGARIVFDAVPDAGRTVRSQDADFPAANSQTEPAEFEQSETPEQDLAEPTLSDEGDEIPVEHTIKI